MKVWALFRNELKILKVLCLFIESIFFCPGKVHILPVIFFQLNIRSLLLCGNQQTKHFQLFWFLYLFVRIYLYDLYTYWQKSKINLKMCIFIKKDFYWCSFNRCSKHYNSYNTVVTRFCRKWTMKKGTSYLSFTIAKICDAKWYYIHPYKAFFLDKCPVWNPHK